jgi:F-type H+-transporting ATPase subunit b
MKRIGLAALALGLTLAAAGPVLAQEHPTADHPGAPVKEETWAEKHELELKIANFVILAALIGYFVGKYAGPFFEKRTAGIRKDMDESLRQSKEAEAKAAEVDRRLAALEADIAAMKAETEREIKAETERMSRVASQEIVKIQAQSEMEIAAAGKAARTELKQYAAELAVDLAAKKIRDRMTPAAQEALVKGFVQKLR